MFKMNNIVFKRRIPSLETVVHGSPIIILRSVASVTKLMHSS